MVFSSRRARPALILVAADRPDTLWGNSSADLIDLVESRLDEVFVTSAHLAGPGASLDDALAAARFMGSPSAVVAIISDERPGSAKVMLAPAVRSALPATRVRCSADPDTIADAYHAAITELAATA